VANVNPQIERINVEIEKHKTKITQLQDRIKRLEARRTELQNTEILGRVEVITATPEDLAAIMRSLTNKGGKVK
jgi:predicted  nucleic acid-binding Zn-ribbon protein